MQQIFPAIARVGITTVIGALIGAAIIILLQVDLGHDTTLLTGAVIMAIMTGIPALVIAIFLQLMDAIGNPSNSWQSAMEGGILVLVLAFMRVGHTDSVIASIVFFAFGAGMGYIHYRIGVRQRSAE